MKAKMHAFMIWLSKAFLVCMFAYSVQAAEMVVISTSSGANAAVGSCEWAVPKERLAGQRNLWDPDSGNFPVDVNQYCLMARTNVMNRHTWSSVPELALVHIRQIYAQMNPNDASSPPIRLTALSFHFREPGTGPALGPVKPVIMLLDGTIAELREQSGKRSPK